MDENFQNPDLMLMPADETREQVIEGYRKARRHADETIEALGFDALGHVPWWGPNDVPLFNVMAHMLGETRSTLTPDDQPGGSDVPSRFRPDGVR